MLIIFSASFNIRLVYYICLSKNKIEKTELGCVIAQLLRNSSGSNYHTWSDMFGKVQY